MRWTITVNVDWIRRALLSFLSFVDRILYFFIQRLRPCMPTNVSRRTRNQFIGAQRATRGAHRTTSGTCRMTRHAHLARQLLARHNHCPLHGQNVNPTLQDIFSRASRVNRSPNRPRSPPAAPTSTPVSSPPSYGAATARAQRSLSPHSSRPKPNHSPSLGSIFYSD